MVSVLDCQSRGSGFKSWLGHKFGSSTLTIHCKRERTCHPSSYALAKKMKSLTLQTHGCPRASLRDCNSYSCSPVIANNDEILCEEH